MFVLTTIIQPTLKVYYVGGNKFSSKKEDAKLYETREKAMKDQNVFGDEVDLQIERV